MTMLDHGLTHRQVQDIQALLRPYAFDIEAVYLFGSRAKETYREASDIDLVIKGRLSEPVIDRLWTLFAESRLPYKVDVKAYDLVGYPPLKAHMDRVMTVLLTQAELLDSPAAALNESLE